MLREFVDKTCIPFVTTQMGKGVLNESDPRFAGNTALSDGDFVHRAIERADLIINVGHDVVEKPPFFMHHNDKKVIHVNFDSAAVDPVYFPQLEVVGDIASYIWQIKEALLQDSWNRLTKMCIKFVTTVLKQKTIIDSLSYQNVLYAIFVLCLITALLR